MARTPTALVKPSLLNWARVSHGLNVEDAARRLRISPERLRAWESGEQAPTVAQLRKAATVYKRPLGVFYLPEPPKDFQALRDFRRLPDQDQVVWSPDLRAAIRRAKYQAEVVAGLREEGFEPAAALPVRREWQSRDPQTFATAMRSELRVSVEDQLSWRDKYRALRGWADAVEGWGVLVLQASGIDRETMRGFSLVEAGVPVMVLNAKDGPRPKIFTILHELTHLLLRDAGVCDLHETWKNPSAADQTEVFCNRVAAATLIPGETILRDPLVAGRPPDAPWSIDDLEPLAQKYSVSTEVVLLRLISLERAHPSAYDRVKDDLDEIYREAADAQKGKKIVVPYPRRKVRDLGRSYVRTVFEAYHADRITLSDVSDYLDARLKHLHQIEHVAFGQQE